jgi:hypothetical protein
MGKSITDLSSDRTVGFDRLYSASSSGRGLGASMAISLR